AVGSYIHAGGKLGVLVEVACESDFVARTDEFQQLVHDLAMHIAAAGPTYLTREEIPAAALAAERERLHEQAVALNAGKPAAILEKIVEGKLAKFYEDHCLAEQHFVKDDKLTVTELVAGAIGRMGENIQVRRFCRFKIGDAASA
ncbi:MAG: translation elongation factor Ts, partial [Terriglobales bacterium]